MSNEKYQNLKKMLYKIKEHCYKKYKITIYKKYKNTVLLYIIII